MTHGDIVDLLFENNTQIGYCRKIIRKGYLWINHIELLPQYRLMGYGRRIMLEYENIALQANCTRIECEPIGESVVFWQRIGYNNLGRQTRGYPPNETDDIYQKII